MGMLIVFRPFELREEKANFPLFSVIHDEYGFLGKIFKRDDGKWEADRGLDFSFKDEEEACEYLLNRIIKLQVSKRRI